MIFRTLAVLRAVGQFSAAFTPPALLLACGVVMVRGHLRSAEVETTKADRRWAEEFEGSDVDDWEDPGPPGMPEPNADEFDRRLCYAVRLGPRGRSRFMRHWVAQLRLEFPARQNRPSDRAAMSKWLTAQLRMHGMRVSHIADMVPKAVALALNPSRAEVQAEELADAARIRSNGGRMLYQVGRWFGFRPPPPKPGC